jgi:cell division protein FtsB
MVRNRDPLKLIRQAAPAAVALMIIAYFAGSALFGANGVLAWGDYKRAAITREAQLAVIERQRAVLAHRVALLNPHKVDPDYADELVRRETGQVRPDEVIIPTR